LSQVFAPTRELVIAPVKAGGIGIVILRDDISGQAPSALHKKLHKTLSIIISFFINSGEV